MVIAAESVGPVVGLIVGVGLLIAAWLNYRHSDRITRAMWGGKPDPEHARRMRDSPVGSRIGGSVFLVLCGTAVTLNSLTRLV
jgi:hypothetical protein